MRVFTRMREMLKDTLSLKLDIEEILLASNNPENSPAKQNHRAAGATVIS